MAPFPHMIPIFPSSSTSFLGKLQQLQYARPTSCCTLPGPAFVSINYFLHIIQKFKSGQVWMKEMGRLLLPLATRILVQAIYCSEPPSCDGMGFQPVCGKNGVIFHNLCWLELYNSHGDEWMKVTSTYTQSNVDNLMQLFGSLDVQQAQMRKCESTSCPDPDDPFFCPLIFDPICAYNSLMAKKTTYANACFFQNAAKCNKCEHEVSVFPGHICHLSFSIRQIFPLCFVGHMERTDRLINLIPVSAWAVWI